ncbi:hypothetical protein [Oceaniglobus ichthyenteri]|uniref:hypothetical protein n=1 Tax=Oceaniglobus ichthyenteri TaxID=2136177 RepID=UPI000F82A4E0|nr:hypothetical protein [Oceaniglobus ichthyenteri]
MIQPTPPPLRFSALRIALRLAVLFAIGYGIHLLLGVAMGLVNTLPQTAQSGARVGLIVAMLVIYTVLIAVPFVPGIEIGVTLMILRGAEIAPAVYIATALGLTLAYFSGRFLPYATLHRIFLDLRLLKACELLTRIQPLTQEQRLDLLRAKLPGAMGDWAVRFRYGAIALLLNIPGNAVIGGGGGICMIAGLSHLFSARAMVLTIAVAVAPVPLAVWIFGPSLIAP